MSATGGCAWFETDIFAGACERGQEEEKPKQADGSHDGSMDGIIFVRLEAGIITEQSSKKKGGMYGSAFAQYECAGARAAPPQR